jgi:hypothetical protein
MKSGNIQKTLSEKDIIQVLDFIVKKIGAKQIVWRLDGGVNLMIRWVPRLPTDIDVRTDKAWYEEFKKAFLAIKKEEWYDEKKKKHYIIFDMQWIEIEVAYYDEEARYMDMFENIIEKNRNGVTIPLLSLKKMKQFYEWIWATEKVKLIENFLTQNQP